jgi:hypothetical protein
MTIDVLFLFICFAVLIVLSGILIFLKKDKTSQGMGYLIGITTIVSWLTLFYSELLAFGILITCIFLFIIFSITGENNDTDT